MEENVHIGKIQNDINDEIIKKLKNYCGENMKSVVEYSLKAGGKRFRPMLLLLTYMAFKDENYKKAMPFAVAIEYIHTYSLIHDDLPCMDNDDFRRGKPSSHKMFGEAKALLAGDALLNLSYEIMIEEIEKDNTPKNIRAMKEISISAGSKGMIDGQALDMEYENKKIDEKSILKMYENKTGKMIQASMKCGAILSDCDEKIVNNIEKISKKIGIAFQMKDDLLDIVGDEKKIGKPIRSDIKNDKSTYVSLNGYEKTKKDYNKLVDYILKELENIGARHKLIYEYIKNLVDREN